MPKKKKPAPKPKKPKKPHSIPESLEKVVKQAKSDNLPEADRAVWELHALTMGRPALANRLKERFPAGSHTRHLLEMAEEVGPLPMAERKKFRLKMENFMKAQKESREKREIALEEIVAAQRKFLGHSMERTSKALVKTVLPPLRKVLAKYLKGKAISNQLAVWERIFLMMPLSTHIHTYTIEGGKKVKIKVFRKKGKWKILEHELKKKG